MEQVVKDILDELRGQDKLSAAELDRIVRRHSKRVHDGRRTFAKKRILPFYLAQKSADTPLWQSWGVDARLDERFMKTLQMKPRRTASGVATITVITKPWPCANRCVYCPDDERMPKSYLSDEPACQRAERTRFHPYLQVASRLRTLSQMGHATDKVELIVLGGTWADYPLDYRRWFVAELFEALNDTDANRNRALAFADDVNEPDQRATLDEVRAQHERNVAAEHRCVGLVVETRPDTVSPEALTEMRELGCTKVQLGVQSLDAGILRENGRKETPESIARALELCRLFGFKTHVHFMLNLLGATPDTDKEGYAELVGNPAYLPDEVKLYPCALVGGTELVNRYEDGSWRPYTEEELVDVLCADMRATPCFTRVSRMIRDISAKDILVGNKKTNLRQLVDLRLEEQGADIQEIRFREIATAQVDVSGLEMTDTAYGTTSTTEHFLQWVTPEGKIAGFLRLSLPSPSAVERYADALAVQPGQAMIREVHVYGFALQISAEGASAQHHGLGRALVARACEIAADAGYDEVNVISAVGTRAYYRKLGFAENGLYMTRALTARP